MYLTNSFVKIGSICWVDQKLKIYSKFIEYLYQFCLFWILFLKIIINKYSLFVHVRIFNRRFTSWRMIWEEEATKTVRRLATLELAWLVARLV